MGPGVCVGLGRSGSTGSIWTTCPQSRDASKQHRDSARLFWYSVTTHAASKQHRDSARHFWYSVTTHAFEKVLSDIVVAMVVKVRVAIRLVR